MSTKTRSLSVITTAEVKGDLANENWPEDNVGMYILTLGEMIGQYGLMFEMNSGLCMTTRYVRLTASRGSASARLVLDLWEPRGLIFIVKDSNVPWTSTDNGRVPSFEVAYAITYKELVRDGLTGICRHLGMEDC